MGKVTWFRMEKTTFTVVARFGDHKGRPMRIKLMVFEHQKPLALDCHSRVGGNPFLWEKWIPAYAGMTIKSAVVIKNQ